MRRLAAWTTLSLTTIRTCIPLPPIPEAPPTPPPLAPAEQQLLEELEILTGSPVPIGTLFKSLSKESRDVLQSKRLPLESYLLKHKDRFSVFKNAKSETIMASRLDAVPLTATRGVEVAPDQLFAHSSSQQEAQLSKVYTVLKYVPNDWAAFASLGIPEDVRVHCLNKKPKAFFESHPKYFEVKTQGLRAHTFEVRRSQALQAAMKAKE